MTSANIREPQTVSQPGRIARARNWLDAPGRASMMLSGLVILVFAVLAVIGPFIAPHDPDKQNLAVALTPPLWVPGGDPAYLLGTDALGRDILSRTLIGAQVSLLVGFAVVFVAGVIGVAMGVLSGYVGGRFDSVIQRVLEVIQIFPFLLLAIVVMAVLGAGLLNLVIVLAITRWVQFARVVRADTLSLRHREFVVAARTHGVGHLRIMAGHILPNLLSPIVVVATFSLATAIIAESSLSFLGLGVPTSVPTWGSMLADGRNYMLVAPWLTVVPGVALFLLVIAVNVFGDGMRDATDPRLKG